MKKIITTTLFIFLFSMSARALAGEVRYLLDDLEKLEGKLEVFDRDIHSQTRRLRMGSRLRRRHIIVDWKKEAVHKTRKLKEQIHNLKKELRLLQESDSQKINKDLFSAQLETLRGSLKNLLEEVKKDRFRYETTLLANEMLKSFKKLNKSAGKLSSLKGENSLDDIINIRKKEIEFNSANHACYSLALPGDMILRKALMIDGNTDNDFSPATMKWINFLEKIKGNDTVLNYRHAELITGMESYNNIETTSYYPWLFSLMDEEESNPMFLEIDNRYLKYSSYRTKYSMFSVEGVTPWVEMRKKELALGRASIKETYPRTGTCADFVNWAYMHQISSNWNRIPLLREAINILYLPEAVSTPDNLAESYMTKKICEVENSELIYPKKVYVKPWLQKLRKAKNSINDRIRRHARKTLKFLEQKGVINEKNERKIDILTLSTKSQDYSDFSDF